MKKFRFIIPVVAILAAMAGASVLSSCQDSIIEKMKDSDEALLLYEFSIKDRSGREYKTNFDGTSQEIIVKSKEAFKDSLKHATPTFYLSYGATVSPLMTEEQDFTNPDGVKYTVTSASGKNKTVYTVKWEASQSLAYGEGFTAYEALKYKRFTELGYPGKWCSSVGSKNRAEYGDIMAYNAYCGPDHIVMFSRMYAWGCVRNGETVKQDPSLAFLVFDKVTLEPAGDLNLGNIDITKVLAITSDDHAHMVAIVGLQPGVQELFYWTSPSAAPVSLGTTPVCIDFRQSVFEGHSNFATLADYSVVDGYTNPQIRGDVRTKALLTIGAKRSSKRGERGKHLVLNINKGSVQQEYTEFLSNINSAYTDNYIYPCAFWQMISPFTTSLDDNLVIATCQGERFGAPATGEGANQNTCVGYLMDKEANRIEQMEQNVFNTKHILTQFCDETWWSKCGMYPLSAGGRVPVLNGMMINGKKYCLWATQYDWGAAFAVTEGDLKDRGSNILVFDDCTSQFTRGWSLGCWCDWYYDEMEDEAYFTVWFERSGLHSYKVTCQSVK